MTSGPLRLGLKLRMKRLNKKIGLIGCGHMGTAILSGLIRNGISRRNQILIYDSIRPKMISASKKFRVHAVKNSRDLARQTEVILLAVKPQDLRLVAEEIRTRLGPNQIVVSILAGTPVKKLKRFLGTRTAVVRAMPNLGAQVGEAITALTSSSANAFRIAEMIFSGSGRVVRLPEKFFDLVTAVSGSGPAYFFLMMELLSQVAEQGGIPKKSAQLLATQTAVGAGKLAQASDDSPEALRKKVTSQKGTTDAALRYLWKRKFGAIFVQGVRRAVKRAKEMSRM